MVNLDNKPGNHFSVKKMSMKINFWKT
jgi:hypothetical protein